LNFGAAGTAMLEKKLRASSGRALLLLVLILAANQVSAAINLSPAETRRIGNKIWQNECGGTVAGLTSWNTGEDFASLGIGHFIWYPKGARGPSRRVSQNLSSSQRLAERSCPQWRPHRMAAHGIPAVEFNAASQSPPMKELRAFLARTVDLQAEFLVHRLHDALPKMLANAGSVNQALVQERFDRVAGTANGCYALVDYVNFKGEGVLATERYDGQGWGLLQVLEGMKTEATGREAVKSFAESAKAVLRNRVRHSPPARNEARWLPGWLKRVDTYLGG
jgi:hypothetical protein